eukprot:TRINITY_DN2909_c0_g1_i2.p1 TRINITY_DN2909_c0_g1~~TRINITY_DN2909_c0_g1_i2.p1  ORF type:complete len:139 (-),score=30.70 TRINITY_DN2909_c0_g1_i2:61-477(-)
MVDLYRSKGLSRQDAEAVIRILSSNTRFFVDVMMKEELQLVPLDIDPFCHGLIVALSFFSSALLPLFPLAYAVYMRTELILIYNACILGVFLSFLGFLKSVFTVSKWWEASLHRLIIGGLAMLSGYLLGRVTSSLIQV